MTDPQTDPPQPSEEETQNKFNKLFNTAMDAWVEAKRKEEAEQPKRTKRPPNWFDNLFGG